MEMQQMLKLIRAEDPSQQETVSIDLIPIEVTLSEITVLDVFCI